jgi:hypothetical protein
MKISELLTTPGASLSQTLKYKVLGGLGLGNTADQYAKKHSIAGYAGNNASEIIKQIGQIEKKPITAPSDFYINPSKKIKITKVDNTGLHYTDPNTGLDSILGTTALQQIYQDKVALAGAMQNAQAKPDAPATAPSM